MFFLLALFLILYFVVSVFVTQGPPENQLIAEVAILPKEKYVSIYLSIYDNCMQFIVIGFAQREQMPPNVHLLYTHL